MLFRSSFRLLTFTVNESPYGAGWLFKVKVSNRKELGELLARADYAKSAGV